MSAPNPADLMRQYWARCRARGDKPRAVHALVTGPKSPAPGALVAWGLLLSYVENRRDALPDGSSHEIQLIQPEEPRACAT